MNSTNIINVIVTPPKPITVETSTQNLEVQVGEGAALGALTQGVIDLHTKVDELSKKQPDIDLSPIAKEETLTQVQSKVEEVGNKIDNIKLPEIDTTNIASKDLERFFGVKPIEGYEFMTAEEVCSTLEEIMTTMDLGLTPEQAKEITNNTLNKE